MTQRELQEKIEEARKILDKAIEDKAGFSKILAKNICKSRPERLKERTEEVENYGKR